MTTPTTRRPGHGYAARVRLAHEALGSASGVSSAQVTTDEVMTLFTGAWARSWPIALSRSSRVTAPARCCSSPTRIPLWRWR